MTFWLREGEQCTYFAHTNVYLFDARDGFVPFFHREEIEFYPNLFEPVEQEKRKTVTVKTVEEVHERNHVIITALKKVANK